jgi:uncharacterized protein (TIGR03435 family)
MILLLEASLLRPLGLVAAAWLMLRVLRVRHPASRHAVWTAVLIGILLLPVVSVVTPRLTLRVLPSTGEAVTASTAASPSPTLARLDSLKVESSSASGAAASLTDPADSARGFAWPSASTLVLWCYAAGVFVMATYRLIGWALLRRVLARSKPLRLSCLRESSDVVTPVAVGVVRPVVILPAAWHNWTAQTRRAVLAHEFAHLRRGDTRVAALARIVRSLFWFHPIAWWVSRQTSDLAELACDAVALQRVGDPAGYSRVLVEFAVAVRGSGQRVALPGLAMASGSRMNDRVDQVFEMSEGTMRKLTRPGVWLLAMGLPALCLAATVALGARAPRTATPAPAVTTQSPTQNPTQNPAVPPLDPKFEVVSIKPCADYGQPGSGRGGGTSMRLSITPGYAHWGCVSLAELIDIAWGGGSFPANSLLNTVRMPPGSRPDAPKRVRGGPSWVENDRFTIEGKLTGDTTDRTGPAHHDLVLNALAPALRAMLEDRFQLKLRTATEQRPMYAMTVATAGLKMTPTAPQKCWERPWNTPRGEPGTPPPGFEGTPACGHDVRRSGRGNTVLDFTHINLSDLAKYLSGQMDCYVLDKTGVEGRFSFKLEYVPDDSTPGDTLDAAMFARAGAELLGRPAPVREPAQLDGPTIFKALELLGLKLDRTTGPTEYLRIESAQKPRPDSPDPGGVR